MPFLDPPPFAAWQHVDARRGFEVAFFRDGGARIDGCTTAVEADEPWIIRYTIELDAHWRTRHARIVGRSRDGTHECELATDGAGAWLVDGVAAPHLDGCLDVDLESSALTNLFPIRRLALAVGSDAEAPAAYVRATDLRIERLEQHYARLPDEGDTLRFDYAAPAFDTRVVIRSDAHGLALDYPGIAKRSA
jgi:hypothetical protein